MILVTSAYGNQGQRLIPKLAQAGKRVRAMRATGDLDALKALGAAEAIHGDASDSKTLARAMEGVETVYHIAPSLHPREREMGLAVVDAAEAAGVKHLVFSSVLHAIITKLIQHEAKRDIEERIVTSELNYTILQPANYMAPVLFAPVFKSGIFRLWYALERRQSYIALEDFTDVSVKVICEGQSHYGATYELCSADCLTAYEVAERIAKVTGRPIRAEYVTPDDFMIHYRKHPSLEAKRAAGEPIRVHDFEHEFDVFRAIGACYSAHDFVGNANAMRWLLGREPLSVEQYVAQEFANFQETV